jgi:hypothetical protein
VGGAAHVGVARRSSREPDETELAVSSPTARATLDVGGRPRGHALVRLPLADGAHRVTRRLPGYAPAHFGVTIATGETGALAELWLAAPRAERLRPPLPGARVETATFLRDGRVAPTVALPPGGVRQVWLVGDRGGPRRVGPPGVPGRAAFAPDGQRVAYSAGRAGAGGWTASAGRTEVRLAGPGPDGSGGERLAALPGTGDDRLADLNWAPAGGHLLLVRRRAVAGSHCSGQRRLEAAARRAGGARGR